MSNQPDKDRLAEALSIILSRKTGQQIKVTIKQSPKRVEIEGRTA